MRCSWPFALILVGMVAVGCQSDTTAVVVIPPLPAPASLSSISLNQAIHLQWADNAAQSDPSRFEFYQVYGASYDLDQGFCGTDWAIEGTTVSDEFLVALLDNGVPRCFAVSAFSVDGDESEWSPRWQDTPRPDARNVLVSAYEVNQSQSGFRFWLDANGNGRGDAGELGLVQDGNRTDIDFWIHLQSSDSTLWIVPEFAGDSMQLYGSAAVPDLTSIDFAPAAGYSRNMFQAVPGFGYVFQRLENNQYHYAALRVTHVSRQYVIFDWSVQTDPGNPELIVMKPMPAMTGSVVTASR
ncbi:MAG TPA: hypothetical protein VFU41_11590 [Gemmatimonadales bacterium]|nr:hypothetical protein [Gemmatimonadales bacterium]